MGFTETQVLEFLQDNDVKFVNLAFCNLLGVQKNISIMADELPGVFENGACVDTSAVKSFINEDGDADIFLFPDADSLAILPWRPSQGRVVRLYCDIRRADGVACVSDGRYLLKQAVKKAESMGLFCNIGCEYEFYLFELDERGAPTLVPHDRAAYCDIAPLDSGENVRREICLALDDMGIHPESSHHERGPGQNEIVCRYTDPLKAADAFISFLSVASVIAARNGLHASFHPKPLPDCDGSSLHVNLSLMRDGTNLFDRRDTHCPEAESFLAGILRRLREITLFLNPSPESYLRFGTDISKLLMWSHQNRNRTVRIPAANSGCGRMELRSPDLTLNPYLAFALLLEAGLQGITDNLKLTHSELEEDAECFPGNLEEAVRLAGSSTFIRSVIPERAFDRYCALKMEEYEGGRGKSGK